MKISYSRIREGVKFALGTGLAIACFVGTLKLADMLSPRADTNQDGRLEHICSPYYLKHLEPYDKTYVVESQTGRYCDPILGESRIFELKRKSVLQDTGMRLDIFKVNNDFTHYRILDKDGNIMDEAYNGVNTDKFDPCCKMPW